MFQTSDLDTFLCKQEWERRLEEELDKPSAVGAAARPIDDLFEPPAPTSRLHQSGMSYASMRATLAASNADDDVFLRPPLWEDIASSIQNIDPENAGVLGVGQHGVKLEVDELTQVSCGGAQGTPSPLLSPLEIKTETKVGRGRMVGDGVGYLDFFFIKKVLVRQRLKFRLLIGSKVFFTSCLKFYEFDSNRIGL